MPATPSGEGIHQVSATIDTVVDKVLDVHLSLDNYGTHKTKAVQNWLKRQKRFKMHFIPTSSSWLNLVERFFAEITGKKIRRGAFASVAELITAIEDYLSAHNADPKTIRLDKDRQGHSGKTCPRPGQAAGCQNREPSVRFGTLVVPCNPVDAAPIP